MGEFGRIKGIRKGFNYIIISKIKEIIFKSKGYKNCNTI